MLNRAVGVLCVVAVAVNLFNLAILGPHPLPIVSAILCAFGAYYRLK